MRPNNFGSGGNNSPAPAVLFRVSKLTCFIYIKEDMEGVIHILLALAIILLVERLIQAGNV
jgi:hypothetical protein